MNIHLLHFRCSLLFCCQELLAFHTESGVLVWISNTCSVCSQEEGALKSEIAMETSSSHFRYHVMELLFAHRSNAWSEEVAGWNLWRASSSFQALGVLSMCPKTIDGLFLLPPWHFFCFHYMVFVVGFWIPGYAKTF